jgi:transposase-like protein
MQLKDPGLKKAGDFIPKVTGFSEEEKDEKWLNFAKSRIDFFEGIAKNKTDEKTRKEILQISSLEFYGGNCSKCNRPWNEIKISNKFAKGKYYVPSCDCYIYCPYCDQSLYAFQITGYLRYSDYKCPLCGWYLIYTDGNDTKIRHGFEYRDYVQKLSPRKKIELLGVGYKKKGDK